MNGYDFGHVKSVTTPVVLAAVAEAFPDRPFIVADDGELTYGEAAALSAQLAEGFASLGLEPGQRIGILLPNGIRWCAAFFGAHAAGLCVVPLNTWYREHELAAVARRANLRLILTQAEMFGSEPGVLTAGVDGGDFLGAICWSVGAGYPDGLPTAAGPSKAVTRLRDSPAVEHDDALVLFTSGSSAEPKAVRLTHGGLLRNAHAIGERQGIRQHDKFWFASPLFFVFGCSNALPNALTHAATLCLQERFEPASALEFIERHSCTVYYGVAPITRALAACEELTTRDISSLRTGTANATPEDLRLAIEVLGVTEACNAYGMTEGYGHTAMTAHSDPVDVRINSQGTVLPTQELRIRTNGVEAEADVPGEIQIRGLITPGYLGAGRPTPVFDPDGWFNTGDIGSRDTQGRLHYVGRSHEMMKVKGINISPLEVELQLVKHDSVDEAFVFGLPTPEGDQSVGCVLVPAGPVHAFPSLVSEVQAWMRTQVAAYKVPTTIRVLSAKELPLTATGKVSKRMLQTQTVDAAEASTETVRPEASG